MCGEEQVFDVPTDFMFDNCANSPCKYFLKDVAIEGGGSLICNGLNGPPLVH